MELIRLARKRSEYQPIFDTTEKERVSIQRCVDFQNRREENKNILAFSGGKDSIVSYMILVKSGIEFTPIYSRTSVDPPELINYIRHIFNPWAKENGYPEVILQRYRTWKTGDKKGQIKTMWTLLRNRAIPPTRLKRYCCSELKERTGEAGDTVFTGVRWEESKARSEQKIVNFFNGKIMVRPIVDWSETEIWSYILEEEIPYCELYDKGFDRIGCIGCPLSSKSQIKELELYPEYKKLYIRAFDGMVKYRESKGMDNSDWNNGEKIYKWWIGQIKKESKQLDGQCSMF